MLTEEETALAEFEASVTEWLGEQRERQWDETMRQCDKCRAWINRHLSVDELVRVCPEFNLCEGRR